MKQTVKIVKDYYSSGYQRMRLDTDTLITCVDNLHDYEEQYILSNSGMTLRTANERYKFLMQKLLSRYHDIIARRTRVDMNGCIEFTTKSSVIELCEDAQTFDACKQRQISRICDLDEERVSDMPIEVSAKLLAASMTYVVSG